MGNDRGIVIIDPNLKANAEFYPADTSLIDRLLSISAEESIRLEVFQGRLREVKGPYRVQMEVTQNA